MLAGNRSIGRSRDGFTLAETLIALALSVLVISGVMRIYVQYRHMMKSQEIQSELQANTRAAVYIMARNINMARYGIDIPDSQLQDWITWVNDFDTNPKIVKGTGGESDAILVAAAFGRTATIVDMIGDNTLVLESGQVSKFNTSDRRVIYVGRSELARVTERSGDTLTVSKHPTLGAELHEQYSAGDPVELVEVREFYVHPTGGPLGNPSLVMDNQTESSLGSLFDWDMINKVVSVGIEKLEVEQVGNHIWVEVTGIALERDRLFSDTADGLRRFAIDQSISIRN